MRMTTQTVKYLVVCAMIMISGGIQADEMALSNAQLYNMLQQALEKLDEQAQEIEALRQRIDASSESASTANRSRADDRSRRLDRSKRLVGISSDYTYRVLDHAESTNTKQLLQLRSKQDGELPQALTLGGQVTAIANYQDANEDTRFGWLMRHPTSSNQIGTSVSEAVIHSANVNFTAKLSDRFTAYVEMLYNPQQNFAANSTITGLPRNNVNVRRAYILWGDLDQSPWYASIGKMDIPFGWNDTVSPFTNSTSWHSFAGLAYGALVGYATDKAHIRAMAIQGGAQFRNANTPVGDTSVPSRLNNFAIDANVALIDSSERSWTVGASYQYGTAYCQDYRNDPAVLVSPGPGLPAINTAPQGVRHFEPCDDNNDAAALYTQYAKGQWFLAAEYAQTLDDWPGTFNPYIPEFAAEENITFTVGARYSADVGLHSPLDLSFEFSRFEAGDSGSPWEKQDQYVLGLSYFPEDSVNLFAELIRADGWVPLNFLSGGNPGSEVGTSWSSQSSHTNILNIGIQAAF